MNNRCRTRGWLDVESGPGSKQGTLRSHFGSIIFSVGKLHPSQPEQDPEEAAVFTRDFNNDCHIAGEPVARTAPPVTQAVAFFARHTGTGGLVGDGRLYGLSRLSSTILPTIHVAVDR